MSQDTSVSLFVVPDKPQNVENFHFTWFGYIGFRARCHVKIFEEFAFKVFTIHNIDKKYLDLHSSWHSYSSSTQKVKSSPRMPLSKTSFIRSPTILVLSRNSSFPISKMQLHYISHFSFIRKNQWILELTIILAVGVTSFIRIIHFSIEPNCFKSVIDRWVVRIRTRRRTSCK